MKQIPHYLFVLVAIHFSLESCLGMEWEETNYKKRDRPSTPKTNRLESRSYGINQHVESSSLAHLATPRFRSGLRVFDLTARIAQARHYFKEDELPDWRIINMSDEEYWKFIRQNLILDKQVDAVKADESPQLETRKDAVKKIKNQFIAKYSPGSSSGKSSDSGSSSFSQANIRFRNEKNFYPGSN